MNVNDLLKIAVERKASDFTSRSAATRAAHRRPADAAPRAQAADAGGHHRDGVLDDERRQKQRFKDEFEIDIAYSVPGLGRFRCNIFQQRGTVGLVLRVIPGRILTIRELLLPPVLERICEEQRASFCAPAPPARQVDDAGLDDRPHQLGAQRAHLTVEDPIEFLHRDKRSIVNQREIDVDTRSFAVALRSALRQDPDVILSARCATTRPSRPPCSPRRPATWCSPPAHPRRHRDDHRIIAVFPPHTEADPHPARTGAQGGHLPAPDAARRRHRRVPPPSHDRDRIHPRVHREQGEDQVHREQIALAPASTDADVRPVALPALQVRLITLEEAMRRATNPDEFKLRLQASSSPPTSRASRWKRRSRRRPD